MSHYLKDMSATVAKSLIAFPPACPLLCGAAVLLRNRKTASSSLQLLGASCLVMVVLTHVFEALHGHYLDFCSALLGLTLFPIGYLVDALARRTPTH